MPVSLRELFLIVRAEDHASKQLRMVGGSLRALGKESTVAEQRLRMQNRAAAMQAAIAQRQSRIDEFPAKKAIAERQRTLLTQRAALAEQQLTSFQGRRSMAEAKLRAEVTKSTAAMKDQARERLRASGITGRALGGKMSQLGPSFAAIEADKMAEGQRKLTMGEQRLRNAVMASGIALDRQNISMTHMDSELGNLTAQQKEAVAEAAAYNRELAHYERTAPRVARLQRLQAGARGVAAGGRTAMFAGGIAAAGIGFAAAGAAHLATQSALAATQAVSSIEQVGKRTQQVQSGILKQMQRFPASADEMSQAIYDIFSGTNIQQANKGLQLMALFNRAAVAGQSDLNTATQGGITVMNAYGLQVRQMPSIMNKMFSAVRFGRTNFTDFNQSLNQLVPAFKSANQSIDVMFGSLAFLTRRMPSVRMASTSLARATEILGNDKMIKGLHKAGVEIADVHGQLKPLPQVIGAILQKFPQLAKGKNVMTWIKDMSNQQGTIQARRALTFLFRQFPQYSRMLQQVSGDTNEFNRSWKALKDTPGVQMQVAINQFKALALTIGRDAIPGILNLVGPLRDAVQWFDKLPASTKSATATVLVYAAALALVGGAITTVVANLVSLYATLRIGALLSTSTGMLADFAAGLRLVGTAVVAGNLAEAMTALGMSFAALGPLIPVAVLVAFAAAVVLFGDDVKTLQGRINDVNSSLAKIKGDPLANIHTLNNAVRRTDSITKDLATHMREVNRQTQGGVGFKQHLVLSGEQKKAANQTRELNNQLGEEFRLLVKVAEQGKKVGKHEAGISAAHMAKFAGLSAASAEDVRFASSQTGKLPTTDMLGAIKTFGNKAATIFAQVAQGAHHMMTGHELDNAVHLNTKHLVKLITFVQRHHKLPKWFLHIDVKKAEHDAKHAHDGAKKLGRDAIMMKVKADVAHAENKFNNAHEHALKISRHKYIMKFDANVQPLIAGLTSAEGAAYASGARAAAQYLQAWDDKTKSHSPSKEMEKRGKWFIQGIEKGMLKEAGGIKAAFKSIVDSMAQTWSSLHDTIQGTAGGLFGGPNADIISTIAGFGAKPGIGLLTQDLKAQTHKMKQWVDAMHHLSKAGAPPAMISQLWEMGPDALPEVLSLLSATKKQRNQYFTLFRREQRQINRGTRGAFQNQEKIWKNMGKKAAFGLLTGLQESQPELVKFFKHIAHEMFHVNKSGGGGGKKSGKKAEAHYHYHAPPYVAGTSHATWMKKSRFDFERHVGKLPRTA